LVGWPTRLYGRLACKTRYRFLGFQAGVEDDEGCKKRKRAPFETEADEARIDRWDRLRKMDTMAQLQRMIGKTAEFRGVQKEAIDAIVAGQSHVMLEHVVHVASVGRAGWDDSRRGAVDCVAGRHDVESGGLSTV
jgi:hypothetical protein